MTEPLSLGRFVEILRRHWILLVVATLVGGAAAYGVAQVIPPTYTATTTLLVKGLPGTGVAANYEAAQFAVSRAKSYPSFIYSLPVLEGVKGDIGGGVTLTDLRTDLKATNPTDTPLLVITATGPTADGARDAANSAARHMARFITQIETVSGRSPISVETAVQAGLPTEPTSPRTLLIAALGAATGLAAGVLAALVHTYAWRGGRRSRRKPADREAGWDWDESRALDSGAATSAAAISSGSSDGGGPPASDGGSGPDSGPLAIEPVEHSEPAAAQAIDQPTAAEPGADLIAEEEDEPARADAGFSVVDQAHQHPAAEGPATDAVPGIEDLDHGRVDSGSVDATADSVETDDSEPVGTHSGGKSGTS